MFFFWAWSFFQPWRPRKAMSMFTDTDLSTPQKFYRATAQP
jgi:hypothetical protein